MMANRKRDNDVTYITYIYIRIDLNSLYGRTSRALYRLSRLALVMQPYAAKQHTTNCHAYSISITKDKMNQT